MLVQASEKNMSKRTKNELCLSRKREDSLKGQMFKIHQAEFLNK